MGSGSLTIRKDGGVTIVTLNRPDKLNAVNKEFFDELKRLLDVLETDKTVRAVVITGSGDKAFCVGADLKERQGMNEKDVLVRLEMVRGLYLRLQRLPMPVIAAINGIALGGGLELALACDLRVAVENASIGLPEVELAIIPGNGGTQRLSRIVGLAKAMELVLLGRKLTAAEAMTIGLVNMVVPNGQALTQALVWAHKIQDSGPIAIRAAKAAVLMGSDKRLEDGLTFEIESYKACLYSKDRMEGLKAFAEKRKAIYKGE
jgi:enoyl-CoA hydratase/carnithine racemase